MGRRAGQVIVCGAGIAGLTAALALSRRGIDVRVFERAAQLDEVGAGLQLSPNATRILERLGVMEQLRPSTVKPRAIELKSARTMKVLAEVPLGESAEKRWGAVYLVAHRADLQRALLAAVHEAGNIDLSTGCEVTGGKFSGELARVAVIGPDGPADHEADLVVGADGVRSTLRGAVGAGASRFAGQIAWRATFPVPGGMSAGFPAPAARDAVTAFLDPDFHLIAYPIRGGREINLVAFTDAGNLATEAAPMEVSALHHGMRYAAPTLRDLALRAGRWSTWPIHAADLSVSWTLGRLVLIGDAAHAMTPFAAQGAAMAIEDADTLAAAVAAGRGDMPAALRAWEASRRPRIRRVARRGAFNHFTWRASGAVAMTRDLVLRMRSPRRLARDLDWLYRWDGAGGK